MWHGICWPLLSSQEIQAIQRHMQSGVSFYLVGVMSLLAQKVLGFTYVTPFTIALDVNEIGEVGGLVSSYLLWVIHCFIVGLKISIIFIISVLRHSLFHCCLMLTQMHRWGLLKVGVTAHIIPNCDFASVNYLFFNLPALFVFCFECCILEPDSEGEVLRSVLISLRLPYFLLTHLLERS